ncbi:venom carboxylesterase-6 [Folsomia candida]|uniref:Venom carboxylesterase-6 n=1 Tax=Folsomia candida TaxID=158441 RepID=A0A226D5Q7_FOLCA|nr:venom carboxylesterase-6 [Folsomia candida]OXA40549.1 Venom carboxylesterase-6 [Folsomia candida]
MAIVATFLVNLLCSLVSCDPKLPPPEIGSGGHAYSHLGHDSLDGLSSASSSSSSSSSFSTKIVKFDPVVTTRYGKLRGYVMRSVGNGAIYAFEGIPYATARRFRSPSPPAGWDGIRDAKKPGSACLQLSLPRQLRVVGSEDCLYVNVYSPNVGYLENNGVVGRRKDLYPVVMVIHGGSFYWGAGDELGPAYLLDKNVILVTFNYRLGVLGFLSTGDSHSPGNYGLKDQSLAIRWVYENIAEFGGDPNRITLLGQNSGAASTHMHLLSNMSSPYTSSGVSLSGSAFTHWAFKSRKESVRLTNLLAKAVHCPIGGEIGMNCLRQRNPVDLVAAQYSLLEFSPFPSTLFSPVIETEGGVEEPFLTQKPKTIYRKRAAILDKPWIFSHVVQEGYLGLSMLQSFVTEGSLRTKWKEVAPIYLDYKYTSKNVTEMTESLTKFYFGRSDPKVVAESKIAAIYGDRLTLSGVHKAIHAHSRVAPTYGYIFGYKGKYSLGRVVGRDAKNWGVGCGEDLFYYFNSSTYQPGFKKADLEELSMSNVMTTFLANFAATGEPLLPQEETHVYTRLWEPVGSPSYKFLQLNRDIKMIPEPFKKRTKFWRGLGKGDPLLLDPLFDVH